MRKIMYLHGLESSNVGDKVDFLRENNNVLAPLIDYRKPNIEEELLYMVESFSPDLIIGSSMGGFVGMALANRYNIKCIVFNPAIHSRPIEPNFPSLQYDDIHFGFNPVIVLGLEDDVVDPLKSEDMLEQMNFEFEMEKVEDLGHRISFDVFVDIYNKHAK
jgi:pimeloyl-ACP methyl ester carboxylesterase